MPFLQFKGKTAVETYHHRLPHHLLEFVPESSVLPSDQAPTLEGNLIIEGDNLLALKSLLPTHAGQIKCVYIDPPYNTGNEGWVYNDNLTQPQFKEWIGQTVGKEGEDAARHDKWCCMMYPRLQLLHELLRDDGVIFISIDDNEVGNLRPLLDEIFGVENFIACVVWQKRTSPDARTPLGAAHDYIVAYGKSPNHRLNPVPFDKTEARDFKNPDHDPNGPWASTDLTGQTGHATPSQFYDIVTPTGIKYPPPEGRCWALAESTFLKLVAEGKIWFGKDGNARPRLKRYLIDMDGTSIWTWWTNLEVGHNQEATQDLNEIMGRADAFNNPKPLRLIERIIQIATDDDDIILDSFAGSGTTAHAVLKINAEAETNRKFILVQQPYEPKKEDGIEQVNICETVTAERARRAIKGYAYDGTQTETLLEEKIGLNTLKKADELLKRIEAAKDAGKIAYDSVKAGMKDGVVTVEGVKKIAGKTDGIGGTFTYARVSEMPLYGEYRSMENLPDYDSLAGYIFYTETSSPFRPSEINRETGFIGSVNKVSYYLLYSPEPDDGIGISAEFLKKVAAFDLNKKLVVYSEKFLMHRETLQKWEAENDKTLRSMLVPFELK